MFRSDLSVSNKNHFYVTSDSTSTTIIAIGKMPSLGSMPTAVRSWPPYLVLMKQPSKQITGLQAERNPLFACIDTHVACAKPIVNQIQEK